MKILNIEIEFDVKSRNDIGSSLEQVAVILKGSEPQTLSTHPPAHGPGVLNSTNLLEEK